MEFEYDPKKSEANERKHGIDFEQAKAIWDDVERLEVPVRIVEGEQRYLAIGVIRGKVWTAVYTIRGNGIRLISARRSRLEERQAYERKRH